MVALVDGVEGGAMTCTGLSPQQNFALVAPSSLAFGKYTFYDLLVKETGPHVVCEVDNRTSFYLHGSSNFNTVSIFDICSGIGGFTMGSERLGMKTCVFIESNELACKALRSNYAAPVINGDIRDESVICKAHALRPEGFLQVTCGFPCQPYSRQGDKRGLSDERGETLRYAIRAAWLWQADALFLECVANVANFPDTQKLISDAAHAMNMHCQRLVMDLQTLWPMHRNRFWCHMVSFSVPSFPLLDWPMTPLFKTLGNLMPLNGIWNDLDEKHLEWDESERLVYSDPQFGKDVRVLKPTSKAATVLHSWGNVTRDCPCGCRKALSRARLLEGGARGFGVSSAHSGKMRHLHPEEAALLCTVSLNFRFDMDPRAALCLLGQLAAPMQVLWLQAQLLRHLQQSFWGHSKLDPLQQVFDMQRALIDQHRKRWITADMHIPREIHIESSGMVYSIAVQTPCRAHELLTAESQLHGEKVHLTLLRNGLCIEPAAVLHSDELYTLLATPASPPMPTWDLWTSHPLVGQGTPDNLAPTLGLGDKILWRSTQCFLEAFDEQQALCNKPFTLYPFRAKQFLDHPVHEAVQHSWRTACRAAEGTMLMIVEHDHHWVVLHSRAPGLLAQGAFWTCYDGLGHYSHSAELQPTLEALLRSLADIVEMPLLGLRFECYFQQTLPFTCGTIALAHVALLCGAGYFICQSELDTHMSLLELQQHPEVITAFGPMPVELAQLLQEKGVPQDAASGRAQQVISKLGYSQVQQILQSKNPWAGLKSAASKPGLMFRLVTEGELKKHIADRAQNKHGAIVKDHKNKKKVTKNPADLPLDPSKLKLNPEHFQDPAGQPVVQIAFNEVGADKRGVALCNAQQAAAFLDTKSSISAEPLALLVIDAPEELTQSGKLDKMVVPAFCPGTGEHTLLFCWTLQLGDQGVTRKTTGTIVAPEVMSTQVLKVQVFRDQLEMPWKTFSQAPVKALVGITDALQLCPGGGCGAECPKFHAGVDETIEAVICGVWSRSFFDSKGQKATAADATHFTAFLRIPTTALKAVMLSTTTGVYIEPRGEQPKQHDSKFSVIWLPGTSFEEAQHKRKTYPKALSLVRLKDNYGIRVAKADEAHAWSILRPGIDFVGLDISKIFELSPLPHGTQRTQMVSLLKAWKWNAKPLQPGRGTFSHMTWKVGAAEDPPQAVMPGFNLEIVISSIKELKKPEHTPRLIASTKTQRHLTSGAAASSSSGSHSTDPWLTQPDPWSNWKAPQSSGSEAPGKTRLDSIRDELTADVKQAIRKELETQMETDAAQSTTLDQAAEARLQALEVGMQELQTQNGQFAQWFTATGDRIQATEKAITEVRNTLNLHQQEITSLGSSVQSTMHNMKADLTKEMATSFNQQMQRMEALLKKRGHTEWLSHHGSWNGHARMPQHGLPFRFFFTFWMLFSSFASALHLPPPFARHFFTSSAASVDREHGSEDGGRHVPGLGTLWCTHLALDQIDVYTFQCRLGEASNPGPNILPPMLLTVGTSNPGGLRRKEEIIFDRGPGLWTLTETQLSFATMRTTAGVFRSLGNNSNRAIRPLFSAEAPLRPGSTWAGAWSGVATISDFPAASLQIPWPAEHWSSARVLLTRHWVHGTPVVVGGFYGFTQGPTWPHARQQNDDLLQTFTTQVVIGMSGVRIIQGDFNFDPRELHQHRLWEQYGWRNAQDVAQELLDHICVPTCKNSTQRDQIWLSPEAISLLRGIQVDHDFADHATVSVKLAMPTSPHTIHTWPRPSKIPKHDFLVDLPHSDEVMHFDSNMDSTSFFHRFSEAYESECSAQCVAATGKPLPAQCQGRGQRLKPLSQQPFTPCCSPSREGEVQPANSMIGSATKHWFKQLRRLQSLVHAVRAASQTPSAIAHRAELWTAIVHARGFDPDFRSWWSSRVPKIDGSPWVLPQGPPAEGAEAHLLYEEFLQHYRAFEQWHLQQRTMSLRAKYEGSLHALYLDLRDQPRNGVDLLWKEKRYAILAIDNNSGDMQLDNPIETTFDFVCLHDDNYVQVTNVEDDTCTVSPCDVLQPGDELVQRIFMHDVQDMHKIFQDHWTSRWNLLTEISDTDWQRITAFASSFLSQHPFQVAPLTLSSWKKTCSKFKPRSARGPDGYDRDDMLRMPDHLTEGYISMMSCIEDEEVDWPQQITQGMVIGLAKHDQAHEPGHFRPITLFSMWYRAWARLRTKEIIHQMCEWIPAEALGFLPHRETTEVWLVLQAHIETMLTTGHSFCGMSTDLQRAFNCIGRRQVFMIAERLGIPGKLLKPWKRFLDTFTRRFEIRGTVGPPMASTSGFPEGCPLSIVAMLCVNWSYHVYMKAFAPAVTAYSFVDNLTLASLDPALVARAFFALKCICNLFGLSTDDSKTYVWGTTPRARKLLSQLGFACLLDASELGGSMTFGAAIRNRELRKRGAGLTHKWERLKRSMAPLPQKLTILPKVFWPKALYGSMNCLISDQYVHGLRTQATKALKLNGAGANSLLRLSLSDDMNNDPGFFQLHLCLQTFQRMLRKSDDLVHLWKVRMECFDGGLKPGPFSRLLQCLQTIGWSVLDPPWIHDHEQRTWNLALLDHTTLLSFLQDAWLQYVASTIKRKTMCDLTGLDGPLTLWNTKRMLPLHRSLLSALHSGAFLSAHEQSRFDDEQTPFCTLCGCEDDRQHWLQCPRFANLRANIPGWHVDNGELPDCLVNHLLMPRLPLAVQWRRALWTLEDCAQHFCLHPPQMNLIIFLRMDHVPLGNIVSFHWHPGLWWILPLAMLWRWALFLD